VVGLEEQIQGYDPFRAQVDSFALEGTGSVSFGTTWPINPAAGDLYLKIDVKPNRLFKWTKQRKWVEIDKRKATEALARNEKYIDWLIQQVRSKHIEFSELSDIEKEQIRRRINYVG
jgi:hypothetical protein